MAALESGSKVQDQDAEKSEEMKSIEQRVNNTQQSLDWNTEQIRKQEIRNNQFSETQKENKMKLDG